MNKIVAGAVAGFAATVVLSAMMGAPALMGWVGHFMTGTLAWGIGFAALYDMVPGGSAMARGLVFGIAAWLGMMIIAMPMAGAVLFGMAMGIMEPMMTLVVHVIFGAVLGLVFQMLTAPRPALGRRRHGGGAACLAAP